MRYFSIIFLFFISMHTSAQDCSEELLASKPGSWKPGTGGSVRNINATDLAKEKVALANIHAMIKDKYSPTGCQVLYSNAFSGPSEVSGKNWVSDNFYYSMYILRYLCDGRSADKSKYYVDVETPTAVYVSANVIWSLNTLFPADLPDDDSRGYLKLEERPQLKDGFYFMGEANVAESWTEHPVKEYRWLVTYDEKLPFKYVSRREYLEIMKKKLAITIKNDGGPSEYYSKFLSNIDEAMSQPEAELNKAAICMWNDEERFTGFVEEGTKGSFIAVKPDLSYFNKKIPRSSPQFFSVVYKIAKNHQVFEENIAAIQNAIDLKALRAMLGK